MGGRAVGRRKKRTRSEKIISLEEPLKLLLVHHTEACRNNQLVSAWPVL